MAVIAGQFGPGRERGRRYPVVCVAAGPPTLSFPPLPPRVVAIMVALATATSAVAAATAEAAATVDRQATADGMSAAVVLAAVVTQLQLLGAAVDVGFLTLAGVLVCPTMQTGFAMLTAGSVWAKNVKSVLMKVLMDTCVGGVAWMLFGHIPQECVCVWGEGQHVFEPLGVGAC